MKKHKVFLSKAYKNCMLLLFFSLFGSLTTYADDTKWLLITNDGQKIDMEMVGCFVVADESDAFDILNKEGYLLLSNVKKVSFEYYEPTSIVLPDPTKGTSLLSYSVDKKLTIIGAAGDAQVFSAAGTLVASCQSKGGTIVINVSHLAQGVYLVRTGKQTFKFIKK